MIMSRSGIWSPRFSNSQPWRGEVSMEMSEGIHHGNLFESNGFRISAARRTGPSLAITVPDPLSRAVSNPLKNV